MHVKMVKDYSFDPNEYEHTQSDEDALKSSTEEQPEPAKENQP